MTTSGEAWARTAVAGAEPAVFWWDDPTAPVAADTLAGDVRCDLAVVGGGFTGLWTALVAMQRDPGRSVVLVEQERVGWAASGRNGGFCSASLTHGLDNGLARFPDEIGELGRLGAENLDQIGRTVAHHQIDCDWERTGELTVADAPWQVAGLREAAATAARHGQAATLLDRDAVRAELDSPGYLAGLSEPDGCALVNPARLAWGLRQACLHAGVQVFERTEVDRLERDGQEMVLHTGFGRVRAPRVALATNAFPALVRRLRPYVIPVYDYVLVTEPLTAEQLATVGWRNRQGVSDAGNQFHYYRLTADNRILWGGYDAVYHYGKHVRPAYDQRPATFLTLAGHFHETFPTLRDVAFTHRWGGAIDTCSRFCAFFGTAYGGRVAYAAGYTGLGVGASRFGARVMLDLLGGVPTELTELEMVRSKPIPFPPEPFGYAVVQATRWSIDRADRHDGRRNLWLRALDALGLGFDS